jgi:hypothetical protein
MATQTLYGIHVIQLDCEARLAEFEAALQIELRVLGLHRSVNVEVLDRPFPEDVPSVALYLAAASSATDPDLQGQVRAALDAGVTILPVVDDLALYSGSVPVSLRPVNGIAWTGPEPAKRIARLLLEELGIEDQQRRVFISHKREDGLGAAEQLHERLARERFLPFIDRFAIPYGERTQDAIADALEAYAFLLLIETPLAHDSDWVFDEVEYALSHAMGIMILSWPGNPTPVPGSHRLPRTQLGPADLAKDPHGYDILTGQALERAAGEIEAAHAEGIVRRRRMLTRSVEEAALAAGGSCTPQRSWRLLIEHAGSSTLVGITPRLPNASDLQQLDEARASQREDCRAMLVHGARVLRPLLREHLQWVAGDRDMTVGPENSIGGHWR